MKNTEFKNSQNKNTEANKENVCASKG